MDNRRTQRHMDDKLTDKAMLRHRLGFLSIQDQQPVTENYAY